MTAVTPPPAHSNQVQTSGLPDPAPLLLASGLAPQEVARIFHAYGIHQWKRADLNLQTMAGEPGSRKALAEILRPLLIGVSQTADPDQALNEWERYVESGINRLQLFQYLAAAPHVIDVLNTTFGNSPSMAQTFIRDPLLVYWIEDDRVLFRRTNRKALTASLKASLHAVTSFEARCEALRRFKRREMLRIGIRDLLGIATTVETYTVLSDLASAVIQSAYELVDRNLKHRVGRVEGFSANQHPFRAFSVLAMGKLGGWELNYSSDVDLVYVYQASSGQRTKNHARNGISCAEYYEMLARDLTAVLTAHTPEGVLFRVDLRLRPEGMVGALASSVQDALHYYANRGRTWERLAFLKAKPIAGNIRLGQRLIRQLSDFVYGGEEHADEVFPAIRSLRAQMLSKMIQRGEVERHVKLGIGGIREIEFIVQGLQLRWGWRYPQIRDRQTMKGLRKLLQLGKLSKHETKMLKGAYVFLRNLEHKLQMVHEFQTHVIPAKHEEIAKCAVRMGYLKGESREQATQAFLNDFRRHTGIVHRLYEHFIE